MNPDPRRAATTLPPEPTASREARAWLRRVLDRWEVTGELQDDALVLTTELVTNALVHGRTAPRVSVELDDDELRVRVEDDDSRTPVVGAADGEALGGRGLFLVQSVADTWGVDVDHEGLGGKAVWFSLLRHGDRRGTDV